MVASLLVAHNAYLWLGKRISPDTDILALLPTQERDPALQQSFTHMVDAAQQRVIVLIGAEDWENTKKAAKQYTQVLSSHTDLFDITSLTEKTQSDWLAPFQKNRLGLLSVRQQELLKAQSSDEWANVALSKLYSAFSGPKLGSFQDDPFGTFETWVQERAQETPVRPRDGHLFVADEKRQYILLPITLVPPAFSLTAQEKVIPLLNEATKAARAGVNAEIEVISTGVVLHAAAAGQQAHQEVSTIGVGSLIGIIVLMWLSFHSLKPIGLILLSIGIGFLGALSVCVLLFDGIHLMTLVFGASLIGIAQDYGIYFLCHRLGATDVDSRTLLKQLIPGLLLTLLCAIIGYLGLALTPFPGLRHMAVFSAVGLLFAWFTVVCWFPQLVQEKNLKSGKLVVYYDHLLQFFSVPKNKALVWTLALFLVGASGLGLSRITVNDDIRLLQTPPKHLVTDQMKFGKLLDAPSPVQYFLVRGQSTEVVLQREENLKRALDAFVSQRVITGYQAISNWVPSQKTQSENRALIEGKLLAQNGPLRMVAAKIGEDNEWQAAIRQNLGTSNQTLTVENFFLTSASQATRHLWLGKVNEEYASIVAVKGLQYAKIPQLSQAANGLDGVQWVDKISEISSVLGRYRQNMGWVLIGAYFLVFALMFHRYRKDTWRTLAPSAMASLFTLALLGLTGQALQLFHVLALMLLLGIGVDYGIFMQEQNRQAASDETKDKRVSAMNLAWLATGLSAASTLLSFGLLALSNTPALRAFGLTMLIGTGLVWLIVPFFIRQRSVATTFMK
ncbi:transporter [Undibacterium sp. LX40W]|uniref:Transporter n=2 Tax=Oxalobacteraceae TaxID=75682 RepID=A0A923HVL0_9BURK|nr:transporter [Undibacterium nitidum]MBC3890351.1 transporter [Undibacterium sp. LX40W]